MFKLLRRTAGILLIAASFLFSIFSGPEPGHDGSARYKNRSCGEEIQGSIPLIINGSVQVNSADAEELTVLSGIGETLARMIIDERQQNGSFYYPEDLEAVKGIGPITVRRFYSMLDLSPGERED